MADGIVPPTCTKFPPTRRICSPVAQFGQSGALLRRGSGVRLPLGEPQYFKGSMNLLIDLDPSLMATAGIDITPRPIIVTVNDFDEKSSKLFREEMGKAANTGQRVIPVVIDSFGGSAYSVLSMIDTIKSMTVPVATIVTGKAMSCGAILLGYGTPGYRFANPHATILIHQASNMTWGKVADMKATTEHTELIDAILYKEMAANCGQKPDFIIKEMEKRNNADWYLTAKEAKKIGLVDKIKTPSYTISIEVKHLFG